MLDYLYNLIAGWFGNNVEICEDRHVVIIGGGYAGVELALVLQKSGVPFTLVDPKEYFHHNVGALRAVLKPNYAKRTAIDFQVTFTSNFIQGKVVSVDFAKKKVFLENDDCSLDYTDLVFAVGSSGPFPCRTEEEHLNSSQDLFKRYKELGIEITEASNVVVVGGGAVGCELAGEIAETYPSKRVTIIHSRSYLCTDAFGDCFQEQVANALQGLSVQVVKEDYVENLEELTENKFKKQTLRTRSGQSFESDIVLLATGLRPNTTFTVKIFGEEHFDEDRRLKVTPELLVEGFEDVYAIGDCCNTKEEKMAAHCAYHAQTVATNIRNTIKKTDKVSYKPKFTGMILTIGSRGGAGIINGWNIPSVLVGLIKGRGLFTSRYWNAMGQPIPN